VKVTWNAKAFAIESMVRLTHSPSHDAAVVLNTRLFKIQATENAESHAINVFVSALLFLNVLRYAIRTP